MAIYCVNPAEGARECSPGGTPNSILLPRTAVVSRRDEPVVPGLYPRTRGAPETSSLAVSFFSWGQLYVASANRFSFSLLSVS
jgi:hypothetical protein